MAASSIPSLSCNNNALEVPEVLGLIFHHLNGCDLKSVRLVSTLWSVHGWTQLRKTSVVRIDWNKDVQAFIDLFSGRENPPENYVFDLEAPKDVHLITELYEKFGTKMRSLDISGYVDLELDHHDQKSLTNLEEFSFTVWEVEYPIISTLVVRGPNATVNVFRSNPDQTEKEFRHLGKFLALQKDTLIHLHFDDEHSQWSGDSPLPLVKEISAAKFTKLKSLDIPGAFDSESITALAEGAIKCKQLQIQLNSESLPSRASIFEFFNSQSKTLEELFISCTHSTKPGTTLVVKDYKFPCMQKLRILRLCKIIGNLNFACGTIFPHLEELYLPDFEWDSTPTENASNTNVKKSKVAFDHFKTESSQAITELIYNISAMFPNLNALSITSGNRGMLRQGHVEQIKTSFHHLKKVKLTPYGIRRDEEVETDALTNKITLII